MDIQLSQIIFQIINFGIVVGALTFLLYKPMLKALEQRALRIQEAEKAANQMISEKEKMEQTKQKMLADAKKEAANIMNEIEEKAQEREAELMKKAEQEVEVFIEEEKVKWESEKKQMIKALEQDFSDAVFQVAEKVIGASIDQKAHAKLIDQSITEVIKAL